MQVFVALEHRFSRTPDGTVWTQTTFSYPFWTRYLEVFDHVQVFARVLEVAAVTSDWKRANGQQVSFTAVPYYIGPWQYLLKVQQIRQAAQRTLEIGNAVILRVSSQIANCITPLLLKLDHPYAVEVVADPYDVFAPGSIKHPLRPFLRRVLSNRLRSQCLAACAASYVTESALQKRYPSRSNALSTYYSDVELIDTAFANVPRPDRQGNHALTLITIGTLAQLYKAPDILIQAVAVCVKAGLDIRLVLIGDGQYRTTLEAQAIALGIGERVKFLGQLSAGEAVIAELDQADLFVLPSYQEGLPRAMVEAMARALPCIGSTVGGIPELLPPEDMVPPGNVIALADKIQEVVTNPERMASMSARNLEKAHGYRDEILRERRLAFYRNVREVTEAWLCTSS